ncbi:MAG: hypothetical protein F4065_01685 [Rhodothermaceae bacterium]|nr:hypothetical protein [Bacteroidota bacterium]MXX96623.1 hypothetical protein [Rhodothermaceae bacterium]MDE2646418.1 hypothetical protein [Bacteroidota bacterium]MXZ57320.1 hypothetical protein [Rhodothermaceae bacterium]MYB90641.1 hypothetical protein [Rhodothermaceae bacterium]
MARIIRTGNTPAKERNAHMRTCAELLRLLAEKDYFDEEAKDMVALFIFSLRGIYATIEGSADVWDERNYWKRAEALRNDWRWSEKAADTLETLIRQDEWRKIPDIMMELFPRFQKVTIVTITRNADHWCGALKALLASKE